ncbi:histidinol dehydrogenase [Klebsormidium nitens]|uniref:histidinol dehydrogenase n=1 Tax=Klebsormidium nitens TaxID=105231 RepID=A0A1Y1I1X6_KLENI|nr:histidinol dehydrogenase [Klebsormidium nitens]|eukprot:GAQ82747.1 histidinol dehydrogenase [Klebsormidium nitens]
MTLTLRSEQQELARRTGVKELDYRRLCYKQSNSRQSFQGFNAASLRELTSSSSACFNITLCIRGERMSSLVRPPLGPRTSLASQALNTNPPSNQTRSGPPVTDAACAPFPSFGRPPRSPTSQLGRRGFNASLQDSCSRTVDQYPFLAVGKSALPNSTKSNFLSQGSERLAAPRSGKGGVEMSVATAPKRVMRTVKLSEVAGADLQQLLSRPRIDFKSIFDTVGPIIENVQKRGDEAVREYTAKFDGANLDDVVVKVSDLPDPQLDPDVTAAFDVAFDNIKAFHAAQKKTQALVVETMPGVQCRRVARPIDRVGLYVPGGTAVLPSTALMLAVPAGIAGCKTIVVATPPRKDGSIAPEVLYCAKKAGVTHILKAGGAQAVAALAWGTATCPKVDKILGPGNQYVTAAKMLLQNSEAMISIDMPAGPSEVLVIADGGASPAHVASDLLSQAEHGPDSQVVLVALPGVDLDAVRAEVDRQCDALPRGSIARKALEHSYIVEVETAAQATSFSNDYAPEHLIVNVEDAEDWLPNLTNAGSVFLGRWTPESVGDYASGTNHVLPTYGYARMYGGVSLDSFVKYMTVQNLSKEGLQNLGPSVAKMAGVEGLDAHRRAVTMRLADIESGR